MNLRIVAIFLFFGVLLFFAGGFLGMYYQTQQPVAQPDVNVNNQVGSGLAKTLSSKAVSSITAYGTVAKIDGNDVTLSFQQDTMVVEITGDAKIFSLVIATSPTTGAIKTAPVSGTKQIEFKDIKIGDTVSVAVRVLSNGQVEGFSVVVAPPPVAVSATTPGK